MCFTPPLPIPKSARHHTMTQTHPSWTSIYAPSNAHTKHLISEAKTSVHATLNHVALYVSSLQIHQRFIPMHRIAEAECDTIAMNDILARIDAIEIDRSTLNDLAHRASLPSSRVPSIPDSPFNGMSFMEAQEELQSELERVIHGAELMRTAYILS
jgi:hypothetical protein